MHSSICLCGLMAARIAALEDVLEAHAPDHPLLATEPALVEEEREMAAQAPPANAKGCGEIIGYSGLLPVRCGLHALCAVCREPQAPPKDHARALAEALRKAGEKFREYERIHLEKLPTDSVQMGPVGTINAVLDKAIANAFMAQMCEAALAAYEREASEPGAEEVEKA